MVLCHSTSCLCVCVCMCLEWRHLAHCCKFEIGDGVLRMYLLNGWVDFWFVCDPTRLSHTAHLCCFVSGAYPLNAGFYYLFRRRAFTCEHGFATQADSDEQQTTCIGLFPCHIYHLLHVYYRVKMYVVESVHMYYVLCLCEFFNRISDREHCRQSYCFISWMHISDYVCRK